MGLSSILPEASLLLVLLNPFLLSIYLLDLIRNLSRRRFAGVMLRASVIAGSVFAGFALLGDRAFTEILHTRFEAFLIFGGIVFLLVGLQFVFRGPQAMAGLRGNAAYLEGSVAMPFLIGPGTVSASVLIGARLPAGPAVAAVAVAMAIAAAALIGFKCFHDWAKKRNEELVERYIEIMGRMISLLIGTIAVEMILLGIERWLDLG